MLVRDTIRRGEGGEKKCDLDTVGFRTVTAVVIFFICVCVVNRRLLLTSQLFISEDLLKPPLSLIPNQPLSYFCKHLWRYR
jgi:hypothetical protein